MRLFIPLALLALAGCQTLPAVVVTGGDTFEVRYDPQASSEGEVEARAQRHCSGAVTFVSSETRFDGLAYRTYRCGGGS
jgi:hypothetical protein